MMAILKKFLEGRLLFSEEILDKYFLLFPEVADIVHATINASKIWDHCQVLTLTKNMRLQCGSSEIEKQEMAEFSRWILDIGEGRLGNPNDGVTDIEIPQDLLLTNFDDPILAIVNNTYPDLLHN
jgi:ATP-dependent DNA helicase PIF1